MVRRDTVKRCIFALVLLPILSSTAFAACQTKFRASWYDYKPYQMMRDGRPSGMDLELLHAVMSDAGCTYVLKEIPWTWTTRKIEQGKRDLAIGATQTPERSQWAYFTEPYRNEVVALFVLNKDHSKWNAAQSFDYFIDRQTRVGIEKGVFYGSDWERYEDRLDVTVVNKTKQLFGMLMRQRVDVVLGDLYNSTQIINELGYQGMFTALNFRAHTVPTRFMISKKTVPFSDVKILNASIRKLSKAGKLEEIAQRYR